MSRRRSRKITGRSATWNMENLTLNDYANSGVAAAHIRIRKFTGVFDKRAPDKRSREEDDREWFDREDFEGALPDTEPPSSVSSVQQMNEAGASGNQDQQSRPRKKTKLDLRLSKSLDLDDEKSGRVITDDIWFTLGNYIKPEDIGRFAAICKGAYQVTQTSTFWSKLFNRYCTDQKLELLPEPLDPLYMQQKHGLRARVIRSMFYLYEPLAGPQFALPSTLDPNLLLNWICIKTWHQRFWGRYDYYFKMKNWSEGEEPRGRRRQSDLVNAMGDIHANPEKGYKVFHVLAMSPALIPPEVFGLTFLAYSRVSRVNDIEKLHTGPGCRLRQTKYYTVDVIFGPPPALSYIKYRKNGKFQNIPEGCICVTFDYVAIVKVLDWWDPFYPREGEIDPTAAIMPQVPKVENDEDDGYF